MAYLRIRTGPNKGKTFEVRDTVITIGRDESQTIQILDQGVSRMHAEIFQLGGMCFVRDLNSTNGTYVNNVRVTEEALKAHDELLIGTTVVVFEETIKQSREGGEFEEREGQSPSSTAIGVIKAEAKAAAATGQEVSSRTVVLTQQLVRILGSSADFSDAMRKSLHLVAETVGADDAFFFQQERSGRLNSVAAFEKSVDTAERKVSRTIARRILQLGQPLLTQDAAVDERFNLSESVVLKRIKSVIAAPVLVRDRTEGVLYFHTNRLTGTFKPEDLELVVAAGLQISVALTSHIVTERLRSGLFSAVRALITAIEGHLPGKKGHSERVAQYCVAMAEQLGLTPEEIQRLRLAALLHDAGKILTLGRDDAPPEEHVLAAEKVLAGVDGYDDLIPAIKYHHELADGTGYPHQIKNDETPLLARILIVANTFDDLGTVRGGTAAPGQDPLTRMSELSGRLYDADVVKALLICHRTGTLYGKASDP